MSDYPAKKNTRSKPPSEKSSSAPKTKEKGLVGITSASTKINFNLNEEQKIAKQLIEENDITILVGKAGSGKTGCAVYTALQYLLAKKVERIIMIRPTVSSENNGFLPGDINEKMAPWHLPLQHNFNMMLENKGLYDKLINDKHIQMFPLQFARGITFCDSFVIIDEAQNGTHDQLMMSWSRLGKGSKMVICGDTDQIDLKKKTESGLEFLSNIKLDGFASMELKENHRLPIVEKLLEIYGYHDSARSDKS